MIILLPQIYHVVYDLAIDSKMTNLQIMFVKFCSNNLQPLFWFIFRLKHQSHKQNGTQTTRTKRFIFIAASTVAAFAIVANASAAVAVASITDFASAAGVVSAVASDDFVAEVVAAANKIK